MKYDYKTAVLTDIKDELQEREQFLQKHENNSILNFNENEIETLKDEFYLYDSITGNSCGSYTLNTWRAESNLAHNLDLLKESLENLGYNNIPVKMLERAEWCDSTIRCNLFHELFDEAIEEFKEKSLEKVSIKDKLNSFKPKEIKGKEQELER